MADSQSALGALRQCVIPRQIPAVSTDLSPRIHGRFDRSLSAKAIAMPDAGKPETYPRRVFVAVTGLSPQIVTETIYGLAVGRQPAFVPTEVRLITTAAGAWEAEDQLLHPDSGWFHRLRADYRLPPIVFESRHIHVLKDAADEPMADIRSPDDNTRVADMITAVLRDLTADDECALHVSIAGGRKTMGFYLGHALTLFGRLQDRLSHVLVNAPYESHREFFYPTPDNHIIHTRPPERRPYDTRDGKVVLAEIPFVRLREELDPKLLSGTASYSEVVAADRRADPPLKLQLNPATCVVTAGGESFELDAGQFALYWMLAERARSGNPGAHWYEEDFGAEFLRYYAQLVNPMSGRYELTEKAYGRDRNRLYREDAVNPKKHYINRKLKKELGHRRAVPYLIDSKKFGLLPLSDEPQRRYRRFGLTLPAEAIRIASGKVAEST